jgi:hypothetical protein
MRSLSGIKRCGVVTLVAGLLMSSCATQQPQSPEPVERKGVVDRFLHRKRRTSAVLPVTPNVTATPVLSCRFERCVG